MRSVTVAVLMMTVVQAAACGGSSPLSPTGVANGHVEPPGVLSTPEAQSTPVDCTPVVTPGSGSQTVLAGEPAAWTMEVVFESAPEERRGECRWRLDSVDRDLVILDSDNGVKSDATPERRGDGRVRIEVTPQARPAASAVPVPSLRMLRVSTSETERPVFWNFTWYRWKPAAE
jgi:hypothetical protein